MYVNVPAPEASGSTVFMVWLQAYIQGKSKDKSNNLAYINTNSHGYLQLCKQQYIVLRSSLKHEVMVIVVQTEHLLVLSNLIIFTSLMKHNGTHQLVVYADNVNVLGKQINTIQDNKETLLVSSKAFSLEVNAELNYIYIHVL